MSTARSKRRAYVGHLCTQSPVWQVICNLYIFLYYVITWLRALVINRTNVADKLQVYSPPNHLSVELKGLILNVYKYELKEHPDFYKEDVVRNAVTKVGVYRASVNNLIKEYKQSHSFAKPKTNQNKVSIIEKLDEYMKSLNKKKSPRFLFLKKKRSTNFKEDSKGGQRWSWSTRIFKVDFV